MFEFREIKQAATRLAMCFECGFRAPSKCGLCTPCYTAACEEAHRAFYTEAEIHD